MPFITHSEKNMAQLPMRITARLLPLLVASLAALPAPTCARGALAGSAAPVPMLHLGPGFGAGDAAGQVPDRAKQTPAFYHSSAEITDALLRAAAGGGSGGGAGAAAADDDARPDDGEEGPASLAAQRVVAGEPGAPSCSSWKITQDGLAYIHLLQV